MAIDNDTRAATFVSIIDGDTFVALVDLWRRVKPKPKLDANIRVYGWNAAELRDVEGPAMRDQFDALLRAAKKITLTSMGMSFERVVCVVYLDGVRFDGLLKTALRQLRKNARYT